jgi:hypothetical protein
MKYTKASIYIRHYNPMRKTSGYNVYELVVVKEENTEDLFFKVNSIQLYLYNQTVRVDNKRRIIVPKFSNMYATYLKRTADPVSHLYQIKSTKYGDLLHVNGLVGYICFVMRNPNRFRPATLFKLRDLLMSVFTCGCKIAHEMNTQGYTLLIDDLTDQVIDIVYMNKT